MLGTATALIARPFDGDVGQNRRRRHVEVPERMVHELEVPLALAGLQIDADEALGEQVVAGPVAAVEVRRRRLDRQVDEAELLVDGDLRPDAGVAVDAHESFSHVSLPNSPGRGIVLNVQSSLPVRTSNARTSPLVLLCVLTVAPSRNDEPTITTSLAIAGVECTPISPVSRSICWPLPNTTPTFRSTMPSVPNELISAPVLRVERDQAIAGRDVEDALVAAAVGPVRDAAARQLPRRDAGALALRAGCAPRSARRSCRRARRPSGACRRSCRARR